MISYKFKLYPTKSQKTLLKAWLEECRMTYNYFLSQRKNGWEQSKKSYSLYGQHGELPKLKNQFPKLKTVHSQVLQNVAVRVDLAFKAFFRRIKTGGKPGYPRFKSYGRYDSITFPSAESFKFNKKIHIPKLGDFKWAKHRDILGKIKTINIKRQGDDWFAVITTDYIKHEVSKKTGINIGLDVGLISFATLSNGEKIANPRFFETKQKQLAVKQRKFDSAKNRADKKGLKKFKRAVQKVHKKIRNCRHDFNHKISNKLVKEYDAICIEDIEINSLIKKKWCNKQILDAAWGMFSQVLTYKAECADKKVVKVNPAYTSQTCSSCGTRTLHELKDRMFSCSCGHCEDRDVNAARNIMRLGLQSLEA